MEHLAVLLVGAVALTWGLLARGRRPPLPVDPQDAEELDRLGREVLLEKHLNRAAALVMALTRVHTRRVPLEHVYRDPGIRGQGYLCFADSTTILARSSDTGDLGMVASALLLGRVLVAHEHISIAFGTRILLVRAAPRTRPRGALGRRGDGGDAATRLGVRKPDRPGRGPRGPVSG